MAWPSATNRYEGGGVNKRKSRPCPIPINLHLHHFSANPTFTVYKSDFK